MRCGTLQTPRVHALCQSPLMNDHTDLTRSAQFDVHLPCSFDPNGDLHGPVPRLHRFTFPIDVHTWRHAAGVGRLQPRPQDEDHHAQQPHQQRPLQRLHGLKRQDAWDGRRGFIPGKNVIRPLYPFIDRDPAVVSLFRVSNLKCGLLPKNRTQRRFIFRLRRHDELELEDARPRVRVVQLGAKLFAFGVVLWGHAGLRL